MIKMAFVCLKKIENKCFIVLPIRFWVLCTIFSLFINLELLAIKKFFFRRIGCKSHPPFKHGGGRFWQKTKPFWPLISNLAINLNTYFCTPYFIFWPHFLHFFQKSFAKNLRSLVFQFFTIKYYPMLFMCVHLELLPHISFITPRSQFVSRIYGSNWFKASLYVYVL